MGSCGFNLASCELNLGEWIKRYYRYTFCTEDRQAMAKLTVIHITVLVLIFTTIMTGVEGRSVLNDVGRNYKRAIDENMLYHRLWKLCDMVCDDTYLSCDRCSHWADG